MAKLNRERRIEYMPVLSLKAAKRNAKDHDIGAIGSSIGKFGFSAPLELDERTGRIAAGHGRLETLVKMMMTKKDEPPEGVKLGEDGFWLVPVYRGWASKNDAEAEAYVIASNRTNELGGWKKDVLGESLEALAAGGHLEGTGYDGDDVDRLLKSLSEPAAVEFEPTKECQILVTCKTEQEQAELLMRLTKEGFTVRSLIA